jgi:hypothetical protein
MASSSDDVVLALSEMNQVIPENFTEKQWVWINDQNNGSYNGQIVFEASSLGSSGRWINWSEGFIQIPIVWGYKTAGDSTGKKHGALGVGLKNGFHQLVDSAEVIFGNVSVQQITPFSNVFNSFKMLTTFSSDSLAKYGALLNFFPDSWRSSYYSAAASLYGAGTANNNIALPALIDYGKANGEYPVGDLVVNEGLLSRLYNTNFPFTDIAGAAKDTVSYGFYTSNTGALGKSRWGADTGAAGARLYFVESIATIRLKDISDFCNKLGLAKGAIMKFTINTNTAISSVSCDTGKMDLAAGAVSIQGRTNPLMITANGTNSPLIDVLTTKQVNLFGIGIGSLSLPGAATRKNALLSACRLYVPTYQMTGEAEASFLESQETREIVYDDLYNYVVAGVASNGQFTQLLTNGIIAAKYMVTVPFLNPAAGNNLTTSAVSPLASPFCSEPGTSSPGLAIGQYNIQLSGKNMYQQNQVYDFDQYESEITAINAMNGGQIDGITSGLISYDMWGSTYRYYVTDLSRGQPVDMLVPKSVQILGQNLSSKIVDYYCFIVYQRKIIIRTIDSSIVANS